MQTMVNAVLNTDFHPETLTTYRKLRQESLRAIQSCTLSETSYEQVFQHLIALDRHLRRAAAATHATPGADFERSLAQAALVTTATETAKPTAAARVTVSDMLDLLTKRVDHLLERDLFGRLRSGGATIQPVHGAFVRTAPDFAGIGPGITGHKLDFKFAPKTRQLINFLLGKGVYADDLLIYRAGIPTNAMRQAPYTLIDIPRLKKQIAVCDQIGEITFVAAAPLPLADWTRLRKRELEAQPGMTAIKYDQTGKWLNETLKILQDNGAQPISATTKIALPRLAAKSLLTPEIIKDWIEAFKEKEGRYPYARDKIVWEKDAQGSFHQVMGKTWKSIDAALSQGLRSLPGGSTLKQFRQVYGYVDDNALTEAKVISWIEIFKEKNGRYPGCNDKTVWEKDAQGNFHQVAGETWSATDKALRGGYRHLTGNSSLARFKREHGYTNDLTVAQIKSWIEAFREKEGKYPHPQDKVVWEKDARGIFHQVSGITWGVIHDAMYNGHRNLPGNSSLPQFKREHGYTDDLTEAQIKSWIEVFQEKGGKYPRSEDKAVWEKDTQGNFHQVTGETWTNINYALHSGYRNLPGNSSLVQFKREHGYVDDNSHTVAQLKSWLEIFREKEGKYPHSEDKAVWEKDTQGNFHQVTGEAWKAIDRALYHGFRSLPGGVSLAQFKQKHGYVDDNALTETQIKSWIESFRKKEGKYPNQCDKTVWEQDAQGNSRQVVGETWGAINAALRNGLRSLRGNLSLQQFKQEHGYIDDNALTVAQVKSWIEDFREKVGKYPSVEDNTFWEKDAQGNFYQVANETWRTINNALRSGLRTLPGGLSLAQFKRDHGFIDPPARPGGKSTPRAKTAPKI